MLAYGTHPASQHWMSARMLLCAAAVAGGAASILVEAREARHAQHAWWPHPSTVCRSTPGTTFWHTPHGPGSGADRDGPTSDSGTAANQTKLGRLQILLELLWLCNISCDFEQKQARYRSVCPVKWSKGRSVHLQAFLRDGED